MIESDFSASVLSILGMGVFGKIALLDPEKGGEIRSQIHWRRLPSPLQLLLVLNISGRSEP
jgi:hypothetical protein